MDRGELTGDAGAVLSTYFSLPVFCEFDFFEFMILPLSQYHRAGLGNSRSHHDIAAAAMPSIATAQTRVRETRRRAC